MSYALLSGEAEYRSAIGDVLMRARSALRVFDRDLAQMQLASRDGAEKLESFVTGGGRMELVLHDTDSLLEAPRLRRLLDHHGHLFEVRTLPDDLRHLADCHVLADGIHGVRRFHFSQPRAALEIDAPTTIQPWWQRFDDLWAESVPWSPPRL